MTIRELRKRSGVSLNEVSSVLGRGFSPARLSLLERGLIRVPDTEADVIVAAIERIGELHILVENVRYTASSIDLGSLCADIRQRAGNLQEAV